MAPWQCPKCGAAIGLFGRWLQKIGLTFMHQCDPPRVWHVDRDGRVRTDKHRPVVLKAKV